MNITINKTALIIAFLLLTCATTSLSAQSKAIKTSSLDEGIKERQYLVQVLTRIADPVLNAAAVILKPSGG